MRETGASGDLVQLRAPRSHGAQDRPVLPNLPQTLLLEDGGFDLAANLSSRGEHQVRDVVGQGSVRVSIVEGSESGLPVPSTVKRCATGVEGLQRPDRRARDDEEQSAVFPRGVPRRVELRGDAGQIVHVLTEILELVDDDDDRIGAPEIQLHPEGRPPGGVILGSQVPPGTRTPIYHAMSIHPPVVTHTMK